MADEQHSNGEIWTKVENLEANFGNLTKQVGEGFTNITSLIRDNAEKTDRRISELSKDTALRFDSAASTYAASAQQRGQSVLTILGIIVAVIVGFATIAGTGFTVAATLYTFTKAPIDQSFATITAAVADNTKEAKEIRRDFTPKEQVKIFEERANANASDIVGIKEKIASLTIDHAWLKEQLTSVATLPVFADLKERVGRNEQRWNSYIDRLVATPAFPCIPESGAGCVGGKAPPLKTQ